MQSLELADVFAVDKRIHFSFEQANFQVLLRHSLQSLSRLAVVLRVLENNRPDKREELSESQEHHHVVEHEERLHNVGIVLSLVDLLFNDEGSLRGDNQDWNRNVVTNEQRVHKGLRDAEPAL